MQQQLSGTLSILGLFLYCLFFFIFFIFFGAREEAGRAAGRD
jgi:hypothetical protein